MSGKKEAVVSEENITSIEQETEQEVGKVVEMDNDTT